MSEVILSKDAYTVYKISNIQQGDEFYLRASHILFKAENESGSAKAQAKKEAQRVLSEIKKGADFAEMARIYGTDGTVSRGGDLGWFGENSDFDQKFKDASFAKRGKGLLSSIAVFIRSNTQHHLSPSRIICVKNLKRKYFYRNCH